jgi:hypothetical protein
MSKKNDLKLVFDFIAEYLTSDEEQTEVRKGKGLLIEDFNPKLNTEISDDVITKLKSPIDNIGADASYIKNLMDRVETKTNDQAHINNQLAIQRKGFGAEIKKLKEKISEDLKTEKLNEEGIVVSGGTINVITENGVEKVIVDDTVSKTTYEIKPKK